MKRKPPRVVHMTRWTDPQEHDDYLNALRLSEAIRAALAEAARITRASGR